MSLPGKIIAKLSHYAYVLHAKILNMKSIFTTEFFFQFYFIALYLMNLFNHRKHSRQKGVEVLQLVQDRYFPYPYLQLSQKDIFLQLDNYKSYKKKTIIPRKISIPHREDNTKLHTIVTRNH